MSRLSGKQISSHARELVSAAQAIIDDYLEDMILDNGVTDWNGILDGLDDQLRLDDRSSVRDRFDVDRDDADLILADAMPKLVTLAKATAKSAEFKDIVAQNNDQVQDQGKDVHYTWTSSLGGGLGKTPWREDGNVTYRTSGDKLVTLNSMGLTELMTLIADTHSLSDTKWNEFIDEIDKSSVKAEQAKAHFLADSLAKKWQGTNVKLKWDIQFSIHPDESSYIIVNVRVPQSEWTKAYNQTSPS